MDVSTVKVVKRPEPMAPKIVAIPMNKSGWPTLDIRIPPARETIVLVITQGRVQIPDWMGVADLTPWNQLFQVSWLWGV